MIQCVSARLLWRDTGQSIYARYEARILEIVRASIVRRLSAIIFLTKVLDSISVFFLFA